MARTIDYVDKSEIRKLLLGRRIIRAENDTLTLDDGTTLSVRPNRGCGGCSSGWYQLDRLVDFDNVITRVKFVETTKDGEYWDGEDTLEIFVYAEGVPKSTSVVEVSGSAGNGYYGWGFTLHVTDATNPSEEGA